MDEFKKLENIADQLLGPQGCPWDREQTFFTLQSYLLEETYELIEAIDLQEGSKIEEELGDVLYSLIFIAKLGEKEGSFTLESAIRNVAEKLVRRHPHVFGDQKNVSTDSVIATWEAIKKKEGKKSPIDGIPPALPSLARAQKVIHKLRRAKSRVIDSKIEEGIGDRLWELVKEADSQGVDAEASLRRTCLAYEKKFKENG
ncbi:MAG: MazG family protein [Chlamydiota bacterium]